MKKNTIALFLFLLIVCPINSQDREKIKIGEEKIGEFSLPELLLKDSTFVKNLNKIFIENQIENPPFTTNNIFLLDMKKIKDTVRLKIEPIFLYEDFSLSCFGYFLIQEKLLFLKNKSYKRKIKKTNNIKSFDFFQTVLIKPNGDKTPFPIRQEPTFYIFELTKEKIEFKERVILN